MRRTINGDNRQMLNHGAALIIASLFSFALYSNAMAEEPREDDSAKFQEIAQGMMGSGRGGRHGMMMRRPNDPASLKTRWPENKQMFDALTLGGQGYDNWAKLQGKKLPTTTHPAYPANGKRKGATTWRCKECHGWDYEGVKGAYAKGSHFSGVRGITAAQGRSPQSIARLLRGDIHGYTKEMIPDELLDDIAQFVSNGQVDARKLIDYETGRARNLSSRGHRTYRHQCAQCHGNAGRAINFKTKEKPEYVGTVGRKAPWEALHKIRMGHPGSTMPSFKDLSEQTLVELLAYLQSLPAK